MRNRLLHSPCWLPVKGKRSYFILSFIFLLFNSAKLFAHSDEPVVTLNVNNASIQKVFESIESQTGYNFLYVKKNIDQARPVTLQADKEELASVLQRLFKDQPLSYTMQDRYILVKAATKVPGITSTNQSPPHSISGKVTNEEGVPLSGANVIIKRTGRGTITSADGSFSLPSVNEDDFIVVSYVGYATLTEKVGERTLFNLFLKLADNELDVQVVQGYGITSKRLATGNIGRITAKDIEKQPVMNPLIALQGQIPGTVVTQRNGYASGTIKVEIRGRNTINPNIPSDPLYIVDGVPLTVLDVSGNSSYEAGSSGFTGGRVYSIAGGQSPFFSINPADIESIEVLKDADATAIYGSRGANGVILITTKKGKKGKVVFDLNMNTGFNQVPEFYDLLNTHQYVNMRKKALNNDGLPIDIIRAPDIVAWDTTRYTDWQNFSRGGSGQLVNFQASLSGGDASTSFRIASGYQQQTSVLTVSGANKRASIVMNLSKASLNQRFKVSFSASYSYTSVDDISMSSNTLITIPNAPEVFDSKNNLNFDGWVPLQGRYPFGELLRPYKAETNFLTSSVDIVYSILKGLSFKTTFGYNKGITKQTRFITIASQYSLSNPVGQSQFGHTIFNNLIIEPQLEFNAILGRGKVNILGGASYQSNSTEAFDLFGYGYTRDELLGSILNAPTRFPVDYYGKYKYVAVFGRVNYNFLNKYILNINARRDGSSRFGPGRQFGDFGSIGVAYIFTEEKFLKKMGSWLSFGKLRASYGTTGLDQIPDYQFLSRWRFTPIAYNGILPITPESHTDSLLQWQVNRKTEFAINLGFFDNRISLESIYYRNRCDNQLINFPLPLFTGFGGVTSNTPANVENTGWEFILNSKNIDKKEFKWATAFNIAFNRNKLLAYPNLVESPYRDVFIIGEPLNIKKLLHLNGVNSANGLYEFYDKNNDNQITIDFSGKSMDDRIIYDLSPQFSGGFTNSFSFRNWDLSIFFLFKKHKGPSIYNFLDIPGGSTNHLVDVLNHWEKPGDKTKFAKLTTNPNNPAFNNTFYYYKSLSDGVYSDASYIRLQNMTLSYTLPDKLVSKLKINNVRTYLQGENLFVISNYEGIDPEVFGLGSLPLLRMLVIGISCTF